MRYLTLLAIIVFMASCGGTESTNTSTETTSTEQAANASPSEESKEINYSECSNEKCPMCSMDLKEVNGGKIKDHCEEEGKNIGFCSENCKNEYLAKNEKK